MDKINLKYQAHKKSFLFYETQYNTSHIPIIGLNLVNSILLSSGNIFNNNYSKYFLLTGSIFSILSTSLTSYYALFQIGEKKNSFFNSKNEFKKLLTKIQLQDVDEIYINKKILEIETKNKFLIPPHIYKSVFTVDETTKLV